MRLTALPPPPPQPTTLILARPSCNSLSLLISIRWSSFLCALAMASSSWFLVCSLEKISQPPHCFLIRVAESDRLPRRRVTAVARAPLHQPGRDGKRRSVRLVGETRQRDRLAEPRGRVEDRLRGVHRAHQPRASARYDDPGRQQLVETALPHF